MYYPTYQQNDDEQQYRTAKETLKTAMSMFEHLRPDQQQRLLQELAQEKVMQGLWRRAQMLFPQQ